MKTTTALKPKEFEQFKINQRDFEKLSEIYNKLDEICDSLDGIGRVMGTGNASDFQYIENNEKVWFSDNIKSSVNILYEHLEYLKKENCRLMNVNY